MSARTFQKAAQTPVWETGGALRLPALHADLAADLCVVGLGGSGLASLRELQRLGVDAIGIDAGEIAGGAAGRNGGFLLAGTYLFYHDAVTAYGSARATEIYRLTLAEIARMTREPPCSVRITGSLRIAHSPAELEDCDAQLAAMRAGGLEVERYTGPEGTGLLFPRDGVFNPLLRCRTLARTLVEDGCQLFEATPAMEVGRGIVRTPHGSIRCRAVIVAVDGRLERLLPELHGRVRTARLQMLATAPLPDQIFTRPVYSRWGFEYWQQLTDRRLALGGFRDLGGAEEWTESVEPSPRVQQALESLLRDRLHVQTRITHRWAASASFTRSGLPILEEVRPGVWAAGGYSGTGNVIGSICGRAAAHLAAGQETALSIVGELGTETTLESP